MAVRIRTAAGATSSWARMPMREMRADMVALGHRLPTNGLNR
jgi:hypothetical protein